MFGVPSLVFGVWCSLFGGWCLVFDSSYLAFGLCSLGLAAWRLVAGLGLNGTSEA